MKSIILISLLLNTLFILSGCNSSEETSSENTPSISTPNDDNSVEINITDTISLGEALFNDKDLSFSRSLSCAGCHSPDQAFVDDRETSLVGASLGDDNISLGDRNAPMVTYASYIPEFSALTDDISGRSSYTGGQFWDGRAANLIEQAKGPFLNDVEMQMPDVASVIIRVREKEAYVVAMKEYYGENIFEQDEDAFEALAKAIADFESSPALSTFDSRYDKYQADSIMLTDQELEGKVLFTTTAHCSACHSHRDTADSPTLFTLFGYENIGVPKNSELRLQNGQASDFIDKGLLEHPDVNDTYKEGRFKVPSLRNVAVTAPYTHNGKFKTLKTMVHFYNTRDTTDAINPDTDLEWEPSEVKRNRTNLIGSLKLTDAQEDALVAFLKTLTDERYEYLIK